MMDALISIHDRDGQQVVSARDLHQSLVIGTEFAKWCKRMFEYGFIEGQDYSQVFVKNDDNLTGGRPSIDYALTLDCAKEIAMLQRSEKGRRLRQYFIEAEKQLRQVAAPAQNPAIDLQLQQAQLLVSHAQSLNDQNHRLSELEEVVRHIMAGQRSASRRPPDRSRDARSSKTLTTRKQLNDLVNSYCIGKGVSQSEVWTWLYDELLRRFSVNLRGYRPSPPVSLLELAERHGHLDKLYSIVMSELYHNEYGYE